MLSMSERIVMHGQLLFEQDSTDCDLYFVRRGTLQYFVQVGEVDRLIKEESVTE